MKNEKGGFNRWIEDHFNVRHVEIAEQIEILDHQVDTSVKFFKKKIKGEGKTKDIIQVLDEIERNLDIIKQQAMELKKAFHTTYDIDEMLTEILEEQVAGSYWEKIRYVRNFNTNVRSHLEQVSNRIDKIKPKIREFIYDFNQRDFDRKTGSFLDFLLKHSKSVKDDNNRKTLQLPVGVPTRLVTQTQFVPRFTKIPLKEIGPKLPVEIPIRKVDKEKKAKLVQKIRKWKNENERIIFWTNIALNRIKETGGLNFSILFFRILKEEANLSIAVKVAHRILNLSLRKSEFDVKIIKERIIDQSYPNVSLWKIDIRKV